MSANANAAIQFDPITPYAISPKTTQVVIADLNGDGRPDALTARKFTVLVTPVDPMTQYSTEWLAGDGTGGFGAPSAIPQSLSLDLVAVGDVNADGVADLVLRCDNNPDDINNHPLDRVAVLLGLGNGSFDTRRISPAGATFSSVALLDVNADGHVDLLANTTGGVRVLLGAGDGTFATAVSYPADIAGQESFGDVDSDGDVDVVVSTGATVQVLAGNGDGTFTKRPVHGLGGFFQGSASAIALDDANGDGILDVIQTGGSNSIYNLHVAWGLGDGTFAENAAYAMSADPRGLATGDFNNDDWRDIATLNVSSQTISILPGSSSGSFGTRFDLALASRSTSFATRDLDGDLSLDFVVSASDSDSIWVFRNGVCGATQFPRWQSSLHRMGDLYVTWAPMTFVVAPEVQRRTGQSTWESVGSPSQDSRGAWHFGDPTVLPHVEYSYRLAYAFDGCPSTAGDVTVTITPTPRADLPAGGTARDLAVADFDGDQKPDVVVATEEGALSVLLGRSGERPDPAIYVPGGRPRAVIARDFDGDGHLDLAAPLFDRDQVAILRGRGDGTFEASRRYPTGANPTGITAADFDLDGVIDLAIVNVNGGNISVLRGKGDGTFFAATSLSIPGPGYGIGTMDLDPDGRPDLVVFSSYGLSTWLARDGWTFVAGPAASLGSEGFQGLRVAPLDPASTDKIIVVQSGYVDTYSFESGSFVRSNHHWLNGGPPYPKPVGIDVGDVDGNGLLDVAVTSPDSPHINLLFNMESGRLTMPSMYDGPLSRAIALADMDGDAILDVVTGNLDQTVSIIDNAHHPTTGVDGPSIEAGFGIVRLSPNPARESFEVVFDVSSNAPAELGLWDISGRRILQRTMSASVGRQSIRLGGLGLRPGIYYLVLQQDTQRSSRRLVMIR